MEATEVKKTYQVLFKGKLEVKTDQSKTIIDLDKVVNIEDNDIPLSNYYIEAVSSLVASEDGIERITDAIGEIEVYLLTGLSVLGKDTPVTAFQEIENLRT